MTALLLGVALLAAAGSSFAADKGPGSAADPVVTKSYVDDLFESLQGSASTGFVVVEVAAGEQLLGGDGTELILRGGKATVIDNGVDGVSDLTAGKDLKGGAAVAFNHLLLVPREDGRGIACQALSWVMVKGTYTLR